MSDEPLPQGIASTDDLIRISRKLGTAFQITKGMFDVAGILLGSADRLEGQVAEITKLKQELKQKEKHGNEPQ